LIASTADQSTGIYWHVTADGATAGASATALGTGNANTNNIVIFYGAENNAARLCADLDLNGHSDWFLPSKDELNKLYINRVAIGGFADTSYWSSSEYNANFAWFQNFYGGGQGASWKYVVNYRVRAIRAF
jgi:hypothetical protein